MREGLETFLAVREEAGMPMPGFVVRELRASGREPAPDAAPNLAFHEGSPQSESVPLPPWLVIAIGALFVLGIVALVVKTLRPAGDLVGTIDLLSSTPAATFEAAAGDRVRFRLDVSAPHRSSVLTRRLESETLVLSIASPGLQPTSATCPVGGASASSSMGGGTTTMRGVVIDGELTVLAGGPQTVRAGHSLGREIHATMAMLHIYRRKSAA